MCSRCFQIAVQLILSMLRGEDVQECVDATWRFHANHGWEVVLAFHIMSVCRTFSRASMMSSHFGPIAPCGSKSCSHARASNGWPGTAYIAPLIQRGFAVIKLPDLAAASITTIACDNLISTDCAREMTRLGLGAHGLFGNQQAIFPNLPRQLRVFSGVNTSTSPHAQSFPYQSRRHARRYRHRGKSRTNHIPLFPQCGGQKPRHTGSKG